MRMKMKMKMRAITKKNSLSTITQIELKYVC